MAFASKLNPWWALALCLLALATWRWQIAAHLPLSVDEAYYYAWSLTPDWGYWTKPPLIAWALGGISTVCGASAGCLRGVGVLGFTASAALVALLVRRMGMSSSAAVWAAVCFATLPLASFYGIAASTDALLLLCWLACMWALWEALQGHVGGWLWLGLFAGLGLLAKYSMAVLAPCVVLVLLHPNWRGHFKKAGPYLAAAIALILFAPNLWWNQTHGMPTLQHTADISRGQAYGLNLSSGLEFLAAQWLVGNPFLITALLVAAFRRDMTLSPLRWFGAMMSLPMLGVITAQALVSRANANWAAPAHAGLCVLAVVFLWQAQRKIWLTLSVVFGLLFALLLYHGQTLVREPLGLQASWRTDPYWALRNWPGVQDQVRDTLAQRLPSDAWRVASDDRAVLAQLQWGLQLKAGSAMGWVREGRANNHFDQRFPLQTDGGLVLLLTQAPEAEVKKQFPHATPAPAVHSDLVQSEAINYGAWWLN